MSSKILAYNTSKSGFDYVTCDSNGKMMVSIDANTITINDEDLLAQLTASNIVAEACRTQLVASNVVAEATRAQLVAQLQSAMSVHGATLVQLQDSYTSAEASRVQLVASNTVIQSVNTNLNTASLQLAASNVVAEASRVFLEGVVVESALTNLKLDRQLDQSVASNTVIQSVKSSVDATNTLLALPLTVKRSQLGSMYNVANDASLAACASTRAFDVSAYGWISGFYKDASTSTYDGIRVEYSFNGSTWINGQTI